MENNGMKRHTEEIFQEWHIKLDSLERKMDQNTSRIVTALDKVTATLEGIGDVLINAAISKKHVSLPAHLAMVMVLGGLVIFLAVKDSSKNFRLGDWLSVTNQAEAKH
jgi:hypothetical protein